MSSTTANVKFLSEDDKPSAADVAHHASERMHEQAKKTDSKPVKHVADLMHAQDKMIRDKKLDERLARIAKLTSRVKERHPEDYKVMQKQVDALKPLLRLSIESTGFREAIIDLMSTLELVFEIKKQDAKVAKDTKKSTESKDKKKTEDKDTKHRSEEKKESKDTKKTESKEKKKTDDSMISKKMAESKDLKGPKHEGDKDPKKLSYETEVITSMVLPAPTLPRQEKLPTAVPHPQSAPTGFAPAPPSAYPPALISPTSKAAAAHHGGSSNTTISDELHRGFSMVGDKVSFKRPMTDEKWKKVESGLDTFFTTMRKNPEYRKGVKQLFQVASTFDSDSLSSRDHKELRELRDETRDLIAQFSGEDVLQKLFDQIEDLVKILDDNEAAEEWWDEFRVHFLRLCKTYEGKNDLKIARPFFDLVPHVFEKEMKKIDKVLHLLAEVFENMKNNEYVKALKDKLSVLGDDLYFTGSDGLKHFDLSAVRDIAGAFFDMLRKDLHKIDLPDIEGTEKGGTFSFRNIRIKTQFPTKLKFRIDTELVNKVSKKTGLTKYVTTFVVHAAIKGVRVTAKNLDFAFEMKKLSDSGKVDVIIPGARLNINFLLRPTKKGIKQEKERVVKKKKITDPNDNFEFLSIESTFRCGDLNIKYHKETMSHSILVPLLTKLFKRNLVKNLEQSVEQNINSRADEMGSSLVNSLGSGPLPLSFTKSSRLEKKIPKEKHVEGQKKQHVRESVE